MMKTIDRSIQRPGGMRCHRASLLSVALASALGLPLQAAHATDHSDSITLYGTVDSSVSLAFVADSAAPGLSDTDGIDLTTGVTEQLVGNVQLTIKDGGDPTGVAAGGWTIDTALTSSEDATAVTYCGGSPCFVKSDDSTQTHNFDVLFDDDADGIFETATWSGGDTPALDWDTSALTDPDIQDHPAWDSTVNAVLLPMQVTVGPDTALPAGTYSETITFTITVL